MSGAPKREKPSPEEGGRFGGPATFRRPLGSVPKPESPKHGYWDPSGISLAVEGLSAWLHKLPTVDKPLKMHTLRGACNFSRTQDEHILPPLETVHHYKYLPLHVSTTCLLIPVPWNHVNSQTPAGVCKPIDPPRLNAACWDASWTHQHLSASL